MAASPLGVFRSNVAARLGSERWLQPAWCAIAAEIAVDRGAFLDLAADVGWMCIHVAAGKPDLDAVGIEDCDVRRGRAEKNSANRLNCTFKPIPRDRITYPDGTFDAALAQSCPHVWRNGARAVLNEVYRVLKPGARFLVYDPRPEAPIPPEWVERRSGLPPDVAIRALLRRRAMTDAEWGGLKEDVRASAFGGGEEGMHGFFRRLVMRKG